MTALTIVNGWYDVAQNGADPTGAVPADSVIQGAITALAAANGGFVYFPPGTYAIRETIQIKNSNIGIMGCGVSASVIMCCVPGIDIIYLEAHGNPVDVVPQGPKDVIIRDIGLEYNEALTAQTAGAAVHLEGTSDVRLINVEINNPLYIGVHVNGGLYACMNCNLTILNQVTINCYDGSTSALTIDGGGNQAFPTKEPWPNGNSIATTLVNCTFHGQTIHSGGALPEIGIDVENCQQTKIVNCNISGFQTGLNIYPRLNLTGVFSSVNGVQVVGSAFTGNSANACNIAIADANHDIHFLFFSCCSFSNTTHGNGVSVVSSDAGAIFPGTFYNIRFYACKVENNTQSGVVTGAVNFLQLVGCSVYGNNSLDGIYNGIAITGSSGLLSQQVLIASTASGAIGSTPTQQWGIFCEPSTSNVTIIGCDVTNNITGGVKPPATVPASYAIYDNPGHNPQGYISPAIPSSGVPFRNPYGTSATVYFTECTSLTIEGLVLPPDVGGVKVAPGQSVTLAGVTGSTAWQWFRH